MVGIRVYVPILFHFKAHLRRHVSMHHWWGHVYHIRLHLFRLNPHYNYSLHPCGVVQNIHWHLDGHGRHRCVTSGVGDKATAEWNHYNTS
jgi:hypothetical protein